MSDLAAAEFPALGTSARVVVVGCDARRPRALLVEELDAIDRACSRFRDDSELTAVNMGAGRPVAVGSLLIEAIEVALRATRLTDGRVDPTVGTALRILGYEHDFASIERNGAPHCVQVQRVPGWRVVAVDQARRTVRVPTGVELDLGATAKALAADRAAARLARELGAGVLVSLGGDIAVAGDAPAEGWPVRVVDDHAHPEAIPGETISVSTGGLATSSIVVRQWQRGNEARHHIVDPETGRSATGPYRTVTVAAATCVDANIATTAAMVLGADAPEWLEAHGLPARLVTHTGSVRRVGGWPLAGRGVMVATVTTSSSALWYFARATGIVALLLLTTTVILGILTTVRWSSPAWPRFTIEYLHRNATLLLLALIGLHVATIVIDGFAPIGWISAVVPLSSPYRPIWLGLGALGFDLLLAVTLTSWLRHRVGFPVWRALHWSAYAAWVLVVVHGLAAGTDTKQSWALAIDAVCVLAVVSAVCWRLAVGWERQTRIRIAALVATFVVPLALVGFLRVGPLAPNWARRSGTPANLLARTQPSTASTSQPRTGGPGRATSHEPDRDNNR